MNHSFQSSLLDSTKCNNCDRDILAHMPLASCEACGKQAKCELYGPNKKQAPRPDGKILYEVDPKHPKTMLLCPDCTQKEQDVVTGVLDKTKSLVERARELDNSVRYNGDFFNAQTIASADLKKEIWSIEEFTEDEKQFKYQEILAERFQKFQNVLLKLRSKEHEVESYMLSIKKTMVDMGNELRHEIREKLRQQDAAYGAGAPITAPKVKAKVKAPAKTAKERIVEATMLARNCSREEAERILGGLVG